MPARAIMLSITESPASHLLEGINVPPMRSIAVGASRPNVWYATRCGTPVDARKIPSAQSPAVPTMPIAATSRYTGESACLKSPNAKMIARNPTIISPHWLRKIVVDVLTTG